MRAFLLSLRMKYQVLFVVGGTVLLAFLVAAATSMIFDIYELEANTELSSSVYQVLGTVYAILLTFTLWGVWQKFNEANDSVQNEAYALMDLVHLVEASPHWKSSKVRDASLAYAKIIIEKEWPTLKNITTDFINRKESSHATSLKLVTVVQSISPQDDREMTIFNQILSLLNNWLDARRTRILIARGNSAKALWPLLISGAFVLFAFHGLFVAKSFKIWIMLLFGFSLVIGLTFYLIFELDCPFAGSISIDSEPFQLAINVLGSGSEIFEDK